MWARSAVLVLCLLAPAALADPWADSVDAAAGTRFIPVELWTGRPWSGARVLEMAPAELTFGSAGQKHIQGPKDWTDPVNGTRYPVYERTNRGKVQLFTLRADGAGLGRVYDSRRSRVCEPGFKFPLGLWREGESRTKRFACRNSSGEPYARTVTITIEKIDFTFAGVAHSLRYRWVADGGGKRGLDNAYIYSPGMGNIEVEYR